MAAVNASAYLEAVKEFEHALREKPGDRESRYWLGVSYNHLGDQKKAIPVLSELANEDPQHLGACKELAIAHYYAGNYREALEVMGRVSAARPDDAECWYYRGLSSLALRDFDTGARLLSEACRLDPAYASRSHYRLGLAHLDSDRLNDALTEFELAYHAMPESDEALEAMSLASALRKGRGRKYFWVEVEGRYEYDDNVALLPDDRDLLDISNRGDFRFSTTSIFNMLLPVSDLITLNSRYRFVQSVHNHLGEFNLLGHDCATGMSFNLPHASAFIGYEYEYYFLDDCHQDYLRSNSLLAGVTLSERWFAYTQPFYRFRIDDYFLPYYFQEDDRSAHNNAVGINQYVVLSRDGGRWARMGITYDRNDARGINYSYDGLNLSAEFLTPLACEVMLDFIAEYYMKNYFDNNFHRYDDQQNYIATVSRQLNDSLGVGLQYELVLNGSTVGLFQYHRDIYSFVATVRF
jgi:Flp pilus assembly protein TadD